MTTRIIEICGALDDGFRICDRVLGDGERCPDHPDADTRIEEFEPDMEEV